ncbi:hypothetical protein VFPBJ_11490 [Purpureocillium lilacinum]|uniref:Uncharacterized protein n=1 Tax=Purpureocillium lilacinum TaxID=33203 RepID=A0A179F782_PURLI|nr:hypothetical protein VFPBJ_11490 [Purpureocillium lilacinum]
MRSNEARRSLGRPKPEELWPWPSSYSRSDHKRIVPERVPPTGREDPGSRSTNNRVDTSCIDAPTSPVPFEKQRGTTDPCCDRRATVSSNENASCFCCDHPACAALKSGQWCTRWFLLRFEVDSGLEAFDIYEELQRRLQGTDSRFCGVRSVMERIVTFDILLKVEVGVGLSESLLLVTWTRGRSEVQPPEAWHMECCWYALQWDVMIWVDITRGVVIGDGSLSDELRASVQEATGGMAELDLEDVAIF